MIPVVGSVVGSFITLSTVLEVGQTYLLSVPEFNQESITYIVDKSNSTYPIYVGQSGPITAGYIGPLGETYFTFNGTYCTVLPKNPFVQVYSIGEVQSQASLQETLPGFSGSNQTTLGSIEENSFILYLTSPIDFLDGQGVTVEGAGASGTDLLASKIISGGGTSTLVLGTPAQTSVSLSTVYHDDTFSIQEALTSAGAVSGEVSLPASTPQISSTLNIPTGVSLRGISTLGTQIQSYSYSPSGGGSFSGFMVSGLNVSNVHIRDLSLRGPGLNGRAGSGVTFGVTTADDVSGLYIENVIVEEVPGTALYLAHPVASTFTNVKCVNFGGDGISTYLGTSCTFNSCYALTGVGSGFKIQEGTYFSFNSCASETCGIDYNFIDSSNIAINGSGSEVPIYRSVNYPGVHYSISGGSGIVFSGCYARDFATPQDSFGDNQYINTSSGASVTFIGFRGISSVNSPTNTYYVDATSQVRFIDSPFDRLNNTSGLVEQGGEVIIQNFSLSSLTGSTSGTITSSMPDQGVAKKFMAYANAYENDTTTSQTITFPTAFTNTPVVTTNTSGLSLSVSTTDLTITAPDNTTAYSGLIIVEGF